MDEMLLDNDYIFPEEDKPVALSANITYREHLAWVNIYYPWVKVFTVKNDERKLIKSISIGQNYQKSWAVDEDSSKSEIQEEEIVESEGEGESEKNDQDLPTVRFLFDYLLDHFVIKFQEFDLHPDKPKIDYWKRAFNPKIEVSKEEIRPLRKGVYEK